ncbi:hypothetical protein HG535_0A00870 [Zygotorulaspora mrakii]|uniref:Endonuclease/exonuclease/phosphatase domain-containing protein n=1 Tax=Zygotorulaspora mrakii TaxID=42260 RepID=A0A7H9AV43_ZYGMR|nr:uncharacterized protein HG535_0A00870 [Zygotorulaspora mrakii]QLG70148.1 hypothetical protein HG535_0A00870 [Zygotorulaspora mrakii]
MSAANLRSSVSGAAQDAATVTSDTVTSAADSATGHSIKLLTFNTWGLKMVSKHRKARLRAIADELAGYSAAIPIPGYESLMINETPEQGKQYDVVALQEIWCKEDWDYIVSRCSQAYPYSRIFYSGIIAGPGLAILSKIPIESTFLYRFPINGRPSAIHRGDWYVGKSIAITLLEPISEDTAPIAIMNSHMHAPYALKGDAAYACHRACQAWDFSKMVNLYKKAGYAVVVVGDLNSRPGSLPHKFLTVETGLVDSWEQLKGKQDLQALSKMEPLEQLRYGCTTCDSFLNTWRSYLPTESACRLDYALIDPSRLKTTDAGPRFTKRLPGIGSFSDHFAYACNLNLLSNRRTTDVETGDETPSKRDIQLQKYASYEEMIQCISSYRVVAKRQKFLRGVHFVISILLLIGALVVTTFTSNRAAWSSIFWVFFAVVVSVTGTIDGLISFLFGRKEIRALHEVEEEVSCAQKHLQGLLDVKKR